MIPSIRILRLPLLLVVAGLTLQAQERGHEQSEAHVAGQVPSPITVEKFDYALTVRQLDASGKIAERTYTRTEYFADDGRERIEDTDNAGGQYRVVIRIPTSNIVYEVNPKTKTFTETSEQLAPTFTTEVNPPQPTMKFIGEKTIAGLTCEGYSGTVDDKYSEMWECNKRDFGTFIQRAKDGSGMEQLLRGVTNIEVPQDLFLPPTDYKKETPGRR